MDKSIEIVKETVMNNKGVVVGTTVAGTVYKNKERKRLNMEVLKNFNFKFKLNYAIIALIQISNKNWFLLNSSPTRRCSATGGVYRGRSCSR